MSGWRWRLSITGLEVPAAMAVPFYLFKVARFALMTFGAVVGIYGTGPVVRCLGGILAALLLGVDLILEHKPQEPLCAAKPPPPAP